MTRGNITWFILFGIKSVNGWTYRVEINESILLEEKRDSDTQVRPWVTNWRSALKQLDTHHWTQFFPLIVHPEFQERVSKALQTRYKKGASIDWDIWNAALDTILIDLSV